MYSFWSQILFIVPPSSILGPLLFNIFLHDLFQVFPDVDIGKYADDNTLHSSNINLSKYYLICKKFQILYSNGLLKSHPPINATQEIKIKIY